jgi:hypothetical protein
MGKPIVGKKLWGIMTDFWEGNGMVYVQPKGVVKRAIMLADRGSIQTVGKNGMLDVEKTDGIKLPIYLRLHSGNY